MRFVNISDLVTKYGLADKNDEVIDLLEVFSSCEISFPFKDVHPSVEFLDEVRHRIDQILFNFSPQQMQQLLRDAEKRKIELAIDALDKKYN